MAGPTRTRLAPRCSPILVALSLVGCGASNLPIERVVLYQNGVGYFERSGSVGGSSLTLAFSEHEVDDALKTLTVVGEEGGATVSASVPHRQLLASGEEGGEGGPAGAASEPGDTAIEVVLGDRSSDLLRVSYAVPVPAWGVTYRVVLDDQGALLQAWALVHNASAEDWEDVSLTLATTAPFTFATDLTTPRLLARPDATGRMVEPAAIGVIRSTSAARREDEARAGADRDGDRIPDSEDQCPDDPETYNGTEDQDGCPDRGRVVVHENAIVILDQIYFPAGSAEIRHASLPIIDAVAATLSGNPQITRVAIQGNAADDESGAWALSAERAVAIQRALVSKGVAAARLHVVPMGATRPVDRARTAAARERNRRVAFDVEERGTEEPTGEGGPGGSRPVALPPSPRERVSAILRPAVGGSSYEIPGGVFVPAHSTAVVSLIEERVEGQGVLLYRPDPGAPDSHRHPFRAVRFANGTTATLVPGPVALFTDGRFAGEGMLRSLRRGETAFMPYAVDTGTRLRSDGDREETALGIVSIEGGVLTFEQRETRTTRYHMDVGADAPARIFVHHRRRHGYTAGDLPPDTEELPGALLVPVPVETGEATVLAISESKVRQRRTTLQSDFAFEVGPYLANSTLPATDVEALRQLITLRERLRGFDAALVDLRERSADAASRTAELRANIGALDAAGRRRTPLRARLQGRLEEAAREIEELGRQLTEQGAERASARVEHSALLSALAVGNDDLEE